MSTADSVDRIIATDYYDGAVEGFARIGESCFYFFRHFVDDPDEVSGYRYFAMDRNLFAELEQAVGATKSASRVFVYSGSNEDANRLVDVALASLRASAEQDGRSVSGLDFIEAMQRK
ncbi:MAG: hypothetical protein IPH50_11275 [Rhodanobacteraceae bacterium]|jgi:hypothetical protein|nr:hypothetical protein [Rhodanobacteraceae bacterium]MBP9154353.1 hypothetical protein [Xanthomonadales bacterium]